MGSEFGLTPVPLEGTDLLGHRADDTTLWEASHIDPTNSPLLHCDYLTESIPCREFQQKVPLGRYPMRF